MQSNKPFVVIPTVDVEAAHGSDPFNQMILGTCLDGSKWGVFKIAEAFYTRGISGTFFVDVYEDVLWGEKKNEKSLPIFDRDETRCAITHSPLMAS